MSGKHHLNAKSLELRMKQMVTITEKDGLGVVMDCEVHEVPNKREKQKNEDYASKDNGKV